MSIMKQAVWRLAIAQSLLMVGNILMITTAALVGARLASDVALATLPLALQFLATMLTTIPASLLMKRTGRRTGFLLGAVLALVGAGLCAYGIFTVQFLWFNLGSVGIGMANGFGVYYRFAAADVSTDDFRSRAIAYVLAGGVVAAVAGPTLARLTRDSVTSAPFLGSFIALALIYVLLFLVLAGLNIPRPSEHEQHARGRPLARIVRQPVFVVALLSAMLGYGIMSLVMTATPLAMQVYRHSFGDTAFVIEWHVLGMYVPSFVTGHLIRRFGVLNIILLGSALMLACVVINLSGTGVVQFLVALVALGIGWNFLFIGGTTLLTAVYAPAEKAKVQALNDFLVFGMVTIASLSSGALLHFFGWRAVNLGVLPLIVLIALVTVYLRARHPRVVLYLG